MTADSTFNKPLIVLVGPTAIGKTALSLRIARHCACEIVSVDSMQVYRYMDIGTAKVSPAERRQIPHHLLDIVNPDEEYDAARFAEDALQAIGEIHKRGKIPLLTGGTGLYLRALLHGIFPGAPSDDTVRAHLRLRLQTDGAAELHEELAAVDRLSAERIHQHDTQRILRALEVYYATGRPWSEHLKNHGASASPGRFTNLLAIGLTCDRQLLYDRINHRCGKMLEDGLEGEVRNLLAMGYHRRLKAMGAIGYRHMAGYLDREYSWQEMVDLLARDTRRYAKRQYTWFRAMQPLSWYEVGQQDEIMAAVDGWLDRQEQGE